MNKIYPNTAQKKSEDICYDFLKVLLLEYVVV